MTIQPLNPGCYGSALFVNVNAPECVGCTALAACAESAEKRSQSVVDAVERYDHQFRTERAPAVGKWIARRFEKDRSKDKSTKASEAVLKRLKSAGVNVYHLKHGTNPIEKPGSVMHDLFAFMLEAGPFKPQDAVEHLRTTRDTPKAPLLKAVKEICEALVHAAVLKKDRHVLCL